MNNTKRKSWYKRAKEKDENFSLSTTQLVVQKLPPGLLPRVRKYCKKNGLYMRRFVAESLELVLKARIGESKN